MTLKLAQIYKLDRWKVNINLIWSFPANHEPDL
jgi:hypothetical protein